MQSENLDIHSLFNLEGKVALVTGGSRGIGYMIARGLLQAGARVYITARKAAPSMQAAEELSAYGDCIALPGLSTSVLWKARIYRQNQLVTIGGELACDTLDK